MASGRSRPIVPVLRGGTGTQPAQRPGGVRIRSRVASLSTKVRLAKRALNATPAVISAWQFCVQAFGSKAGPFA